MSAQGPWKAMPAIGHPRKYRVQRDTRSGVEVLKSAGGRFSLFATYANAAAKARRLNKDEAIDAELRAKYAGQPELPARSLGQTIAKAIGR